MSNLLAIDYGDTNIGIAIGDTDMKIASPYAILKNEGLDIVFDALEQIIEDEEIDTLVLGVPITLSGQDSEQTLISKKFGKELEEKFSQLHLEYYDERFSTQEAEKSLIGQRGLKDSVAAQVILQGYLDSLNN